VKSNKVQLLIPVENQVRELDPKLLLAYVAARRGFPSVIGPRREMHLHLTSFARSIYLSKSTTMASVKVFRILRKLGHEIVAWDEEALVHPPQDIYFSRRMNPTALTYVSHLLAWGPENVDLWRQYSQLPKEMSIHITGNPRGDILRPELHGFYEKEVKELRQKYGEFILVNTNFNHVNGFVPILNLFQPVKGLRNKPKFGRAAKGMSFEYAQGLRDHKQAVFEEFKRLIPMLAKAFPDHNIVVRPHPTENQQVYNDIAQHSSRVQVTNEGYIVPWLLAAKVLVHNGCTTGVEAYAMGVPAVSYRVKVDENYDLGFYRLPNLLSQQCFNFEELCQTLQKILRGEADMAGDAERKALIDRYLAARSGPFACERIVDVIETIMGGRSELPEPAFVDRLLGWSGAVKRLIKKRIKEHHPGYSHNSPEFQRHRYPGISPEQLCEKLARFSQLLGDTWQAEIKQIRDQFFLIR
jgi:surface carbohydrate biosynthesis protein